MTIEQAIFRRTELLIGDEAMERLSSKRVIIFGVGGVGSWCAESLIRSGIRQLTIVDSDRICITNVNRQLMATTKTIGKVKVDVLRERLLSINPSAEITAMQQIFNEETADSFNIGSYDYVVDAIDSLKDKTLLILMACKEKVRLYSSMGTALKIDPTRIRVVEFWKVSGDPLARALRKRLSVTDNIRVESSFAFIQTNCFKTKVRTLLAEYRNVCVLKRRTDQVTLCYSTTNGVRLKHKSTAPFHTSPLFSDLR